jgi:hypothetical protein
MPTHVKISIEPGIRELFLKQELLDFLGHRIDWLDPCCPYFYFPELWFMCCLSLYCVLCPVSCVLCPVSCVLCQISSHVMCKEPQFVVFCVVFFLSVFLLCLLHLTLSVSVDCPFLIDPSIFSNVYLHVFGLSITDCHFDIPRH